MMFSRDHIVYFGQGTQTRHSVARDKQFRAVVPDTPTYTIVLLPHGTESAEREIKASAGSTIDPTASTIATTAAGPGTNARQVTLASKTDFAAGKRYLIQKDGQHEETVLEGVDDTTEDVYLQDGLTRNWPVGSDVIGIELPWTFPSTETDGDDAEIELERGGGPYAIDWLATIDGSKIAWRELIWLRRMAPRIKVTVHDVKRIDQTLGGAIGDKFKIEPALMVAVTQLDSRLRAMDKEPSRFYSDLATLAVAYWTAANLRLQLESERSQMLAEKWQEQGDMFFGELTAGRHPKDTVEVSLQDQAPEFGTSEGVSDLWTLG